MEKIAGQGQESNEPVRPLEIDIRTILVQLGIKRERWPEEYKDAVSSQS